MERTENYLNLSRGFLESLIAVGAVRLATLITSTIAQLLISIGGMTLQSWLGCPQGAPQSPWCRK